MSYRGATGFGWGSGKKGFIEVLAKVLWPADTENVLVEFLYIICSTSVAFGFHVVLWELNCHSLFHVSCDLGYHFFFLFFFFLKSSRYLLDFRSYH